VVRVPPLGDRRHRAVRIDMAGAFAVAQLGDRVSCRRRSRFLVLVRLVVIGVASRAIRLVGRAGPGDLLGVVAMAVRAIQRRAMLARISGAVVRIAHCRPAGDAVALFAWQRRHEVVRRLARRARAIVAAGTRSGHGRVVERRRHPGQSRMAVAALGVRRNMRGRLAGGDSPVVA